MSRIFQLPRQVPLVSGAVSPGAKANFFLTLTTTPTNTFTDAALTTPHENPVIANAAGEFATIYLDPDVVYKLTLDDTNDALIYTEDPIQDALTQSNIGKIFYPKSSAETTAGVTIVNFFEFYGHILRYGTNTTPGTTDMTTAAQASVDAAEQGGTTAHGNDGDTYLLSGATTYTALGVTENVAVSLKDGVVFDGRGCKFVRAGVSGDTVTNQFWFFSNLVTAATLAEIFLMSGLTSL